MRYLSIAEVILIHARLIQQTGGSRGIRDLGLLESALGRSQVTFNGADLYPTLIEKAAALMESLCQNQAFIDDNKRTALVAAGLFLELNGLMLDATNDEAYRFMMDLARGNRALSEIVEWLKLHTRSI